MATGGELLARSLRSAGVTTVFALHGGHLNPFLAGCAANGIRLIDGRHEAAVGNSADGYARATGGLGIAAVTAGAGFANVLPALVSAHVDRIPLLVITSSPPLREAELNELQGGVDQAGIVRPVTRWAHRVTTPDRIPDLAALAIRKAWGPPPGPVLLDIPVDVMYRDGGDAGSAAPAAVGAAAPSADSVRGACTLLRSARRPVVVAGNGLRWACGTDALITFAERAGIPVFHQVSTMGLPAGHRLNAGGAWHLEALSEVAGHRPDLVLLAGARLGRFLGGRSGSMIPDSASLIQIDVDGSEIGRVREADVPVVADVRETLLALSACVEADWPDWSEWAAAAALARARPSRFQQDPQEIGGRMHPYFAVRGVLKALDPGATVVVDGGEAAGWVWESLSGYQAADIMGFGGYLGILGLATGLALGAQAARPASRVVLFCGDGAAGFHFQELDTMARHGLPVIMVVINNASWSQSARGQRKESGPGGEIISQLEDTSYEQAAIAFGAYGERVTHVQDIAPAIRRALDSGRPACINLAVSAEPEPRTAAGMGKPARHGDLVLPYYESIPSSSQ